MKYVFITGFVLMAAAQWFVPLAMIHDAEQTHDEGKAYRFKTTPVDPSDPFRGKYITLYFDAQQYYPADTNELHFQSDENVYAKLSTDSAGFAKIVKLLPEAPGDDADYITARISYAHRDFKGNALINLELPFDRFYLEESKASEAEKLYWSSRQDSTMVCYGDVRIRDGNAILVDVVMNDTSIVEIVEKMNAELTH